MATGFRAGEIRSLIPADFQVDGERPSIRVRASCSKNGKEALQPIRADMAAILRDWLAGKPAGEPVLIIPERTAEMLRIDLASAGIAHRTEAGVIDFHALRHSYITLLGQAGIDPKTLQELARHSTITLTMRYMHTDDDRKRAAIDGGPNE
jgi:integrase